MTAVEPISHRARTKIVATVGPACSSLQMLEELVGAGVDVFRLNMAHGSRDEQNESLQNIRAASVSGERPIGILVDLAGPKIRLGEIENEPLVCHEGHEFRFVREPTDDATELTSNYPLLIDELSVGDRVLLADGTVEMVVIEKKPSHVACRVIGPGKLRSRQGINLPGVQLSVPAMNDSDREDAAWAAENDADFVSLSFVRDPSDMLQLKEVLRQANSNALAIAKIEKPEALERLDEIVQASDGVMVARGDLGVETNVAEMPVRQKEIIRCCQKWKRPVIVATQMLDSMQQASRPTRAEVTDVANAIMDGTDACMLSGETAVGEFPVESVQMMNRIMQSTEQAMSTELRRRDLPEVGDAKAAHPITSAVISGATVIAHELDAKIVVIATRSGRTALSKSKQRDFVPTIAVSDSDRTLRQMCLFWGITPIAGAPPDLDRELAPFINDWGRTHGVLQPRDRVVFVAGTRVRAGAHNQLVVLEVESPNEADE